MRVLVTGGCGLLGRAVVNELVSHGYEVVVLDLQSPEKKVDKAEFRQGRVDHSETVMEAMAGASAVVHLAAMPRPDTHPDRQVFSNNSLATFTVLNSAGQVRVPLVILASSISVLGLVWSREQQQPPALPVDESSELQVADPYALSKQVDESAAQMAFRRWGTTVLSYRFPDLGSTARLASRGAASSHDPAFANRELWGYLHLADAARAVRLGLVAKVKGARVINVIAGDSLGGVDVMAATRTFFPSTPIRSSIAAGCGAYDVSRAASLLGFRSSIRWDGAASHDHGLYEPLARQQPVVRVRPNQKFHSLNEDIGGLG